ncbi:MAG: deoxyribose-phosphate aldolase [Cyanobacteria bacterium SZAS LIN-3]|nr:deoxyribose-phosphate aldolase [Cyanobacteria bacterium SZAS LIN-3]MBS2009973.1 deoxyribose-phosphate aldolase [Cyanobacteria bacterium SZAS TMP-1]
MSIEIAKYIDHTLLSPQATRAQITKLCQEAAENNFFAVCVNPCHVRQAVKELSSTKVAVATVIGFPLGANLTDIKIAETQRAISEGAEEIDMVINVGMLKSGDTEYIENEIKAIVRAAKEVPVKVIIECDLLSDDEKVAASEACVKAGAAMVKTSTGFVKDGAGATVQDIELIKKAIAGSKLGIKASAGIRDYDKAKALIDAGATRLGTSAGIDIVKGAKGEKVETAKAAY